MCNATILQLTWITGQNYLRIEIESLQRVNNQGVFCQMIVHDHVEAIQEGGSLNNGLVVGIVQTLEPKEDKRQFKLIEKLI